VLNVVIIVINRIYNWMVDTKLVCAVQENLSSAH